MTTKVLVPSGVLGLGFDREALALGVAEGADIIAIDGGSTDSGPFYLGTAQSKYARATCKAEWRDLMLARAQLDVPLVIGSAGTCGADSMVDWMLALTQELAVELGQSPKIALLYSEQSQTTLQSRWSQISPLAAAPAFEQQDIDTLSHCVALAGVEQIQAALDTGADIIIAGRCTDTAVIAALPISRGEHVAAAWHGGKIAECGALCTSHPVTGCVMLEVDQTGFTIRPLHPDAQCTPHSVSAHMLYENADPVVLYEPGGHLDVSTAQYRALDERSVRVEGSTWIKAERYTVKLEAARIRGYQYSLLALVRDPHYVKHIRQWSAHLQGFLHRLIEDTMGELDYDLQLRLIGVDATLGELEFVESHPVEVGVLGLITASSDDQAQEIAKLCNPHFLHFSLTDDEPSVTFAFPYSPAETSRGAQYEFVFNHVMELIEPMDGFRLKVVS
ncbi:MAG: acyclic terpene utilization AtuA family protein [Gammaproteobacteria bacterium]|nr:acyclic terpene utilization AtuA family protein [Gammaproteobacteria bacterium]